MTKIIKYILVTYVGLVLINSLILPPIDFISIDNLLFPFALVGVIYLYRENSIFKWSILFVLVSFISSILSNYYNGGLTLSEMLWSIRIFKLFAVGWSVYYFVQTYPLLFKKFVFFSFIGFTIINALELLEWGFVLELYSPNQHMIDALNNSYLDGRVFGVTTNPNSNGLILALFGLYYFVSNEKYKYTLVSMAGFLLIMTQSRTVFIAFFGVLFIILTISFVRKNKKYLLAVLVASVGGFLILLNLKLQNLSSLLNGSAFKSNSITTRFDILEKVFDVNNSRPFLGHGKVSHIPELVGGSIDNEFAYIYLEYGVLGVFSILLLVVGLFYLTSCKMLNWQAIGLVLIMLIGGLTNLAFTSLDVSPIFVLLFVAALLEKKSLNNKSRT